MKIFIFFTCLALCTAVLEDFHKFTTRFFRGIGITENMEFINKCMTKEEEMSWEKIYMELRKLDGNVPLNVFTRYANTIMTLVTNAYPCATEKHKIETITNKIIKLLTDGLKFIEKFTRNRSRINDTLRTQLDANDRGDFERAGAIAGNLVNWFFLIN